MSKRTISKAVSVVLCICIIASMMLQSNITYAAGGSASIVVEQSQVNGVYDLNLTKVGDIDWVHFKADGNGDYTPIYKSTTSSAISFETLSNTGIDAKPDNGDTNRVSNTWTDGMTGYETGTNDTGFCVFYPADSRKPGICNSNGWNFKVTAQPVETTVVFTVGLWQSKVDVKFYMNSDVTPVETKTIQADGTSQVFKYQVTVPANTTLKVQGVQTQTLVEWGNFSVSSIAVGTKGLNIAQNQVNGTYNMNLSNIGNIDWLHLKGNGSGAITNICKSTTSSAITFSTLSDGSTDGTTGTEGKVDNGDYNRISSTWNDGMSGYTSGTNDTGFGVFFPKVSRGPGNFSNVGCTFTVAPQAVPTTVVFSVGLWEANADVKFYMDDQYVNTKTVHADRDSQVYYYQINVSANTALKVEVSQTQTLNGWGNFSLSSIAVSSKEVANKVPLQALYNACMSFNQSLYSDTSWTNFDNARIAAKAVIDNENATQSDVETAITNLNQAKIALVKISNIMIAYTGNVGNSYTLGSAGDQQDRYQTFTSNESFKMGYVQFRLAKYSDAVSDLIVKLYATDSNGLPTGAPLAQTTVNKDDVVNNGLTTAKLSYDIVAGTRYALDITQANLIGGYGWQVMSKNDDTKSEFFGKSVSGDFKDESSLGTGILRIIREPSVDRSALEALVAELSNYNGKIYTAESWVVLANTLDNAKACLNNFDSTLTQVTDATSQLQAAKDGLVMNIDIKNFDSLVSTLDGAVVKGYTDSSVAAFNSAVAEAKALGSNASDNDKLNAYVAILNAIAKLQEAGQYTYQTESGLTGSFGCEADMNAPIAFIDGSFKLVSRGDLMIKFGVAGLKDKGVSINWYNRDGYLPCYVSEYTVDNVAYKIEEFANKHIIDGNPVEVAYVKVTTTNNSGEKRLLPVVSKELLPVNDAAVSTSVINPGETVVREYAIKADRFENEGHKGEGLDIPAKVDFPTDQKILEAAKAVADTGKSSVFENNYADMKAYWDNRLKDIIDIQLPNSKDANDKDSLVNAYKAGYIYTLIIKDNAFLHVGENGYDRLYSHDTIGILQSLITAGDFKDAQSYLESVPMTGGINIENGQIDGNLYWDANWKLPWAYSVYLSKTGDIEFIRAKFEDVIKKMARSIHDDRTGANHDGIMKTTYAIDEEGQWTVDNHAALTGLTAYRYICNELAVKESSNKDYYLSEAQWAKDEYDSLLKVVTDTLENTIKSNNLNYIPASIIQPNTENRCRDIRDGNWASMLLFGAYAWDGYLYGADQTKAGDSISMIDQTYLYGINRRASLPEASPYNFGGYPHGWYSSAYNAGYGTYALRGEAFRDMGIKAYEFAIDSAMSSPFGWWEGVGPADKDYPAQDPTSPLWNRDNAARGGGSCQHMWGQATASKVLFDSLIAERIYNDNKNVDIIVGRGIPDEWVTNATDSNKIVADVKNYPVLQGGRAGYHIERVGNNLNITFNLNKTNSKVDSATAVQMSVELPIMVNNIESATAGTTIDNTNGIVKVPANMTSVSITLKDTTEKIDVTKITLDKSSLTMFKGESQKLVATIEPENATNKAVEWSSSDPYIATVDNTGTVTGLRAGTAIITATAGNGLRVATCNVTVQQKVKKTKAHLNIDGKLDESDWQLDQEMKVTFGNTDNSVKSGTLWDDKYLYAAFDVTDANVINSNAAGPWDDDSIEIYIDGDLCKGDYNNHTVQYIFRWADNTIYKYGNNSASTEGILHNMVKTDTGYTFEVAIPWADIGSLTVADRKTIGFTAHVNDKDVNDSSASYRGVLSLTPRAYDFQDSTHWAEMQLSPLEIPSNELVKVVIASDKTQMKVNDSMALSCTGKLANGEGADLSGAKIEYGTDRSDLIAFGNSTAKALGAGTANIWATVTLNGVTIKSNTIAVQINNSSNNNNNNNNSNNNNNNNNNSAVINVKPQNIDNGVATSKVSLADIENAFKNAVTDDKNQKTVIINVSSMDGAIEYLQQLPTSVLQSTNSTRKVEIDTPIGTVVIPTNALKSANIGHESIGVSIGLADKSSMSEALKQKIGNRPAIELNFKEDGKIVPWNNPNTQVKVLINYKPTSEELKDPEHIVVYYIDRNGKTIAMPSGRYDAGSGKVTFTATHFSKYTVAYVKKSFNDIGKYSWAVKPIEVLASKGIVEGVSDTKFNPEKKITRAEFIGWLVKTLGLTAEVDTNFDDVCKKCNYYQEIGIAKKLGITSGVGENKFNPAKEISRQDMMVLTVKALKAAGKTLSYGTQNDIEKYTDASKVAGYAVESVAAMVKEGLIVGSGNKLNPTASISRAEVSVVLYKIYTGK